MAGVPFPDYGDAWIPDTGGGGEAGLPPPRMLELLVKFGQKGIVISAIVTWIGAQIDTQVTDAWKSLAERCLLEGEVTAAKDSLKNARGQVLENLVPDFKKKRSGDGKKVKEIDDIRKALVALQTAGEMPLILASSAQMVRCPQSWGVPVTATVQDLMGKMIMLEQVVSSNMDSQKEQMDKLRQDLVATKKGEPRTPSLPEILITGDTPSKKRKLAEAQTQLEGQVAKPTETFASVAGVQPLLQNILKIGRQQQQQQQQQQHYQQQNQGSKPQRNILFGSARSTGTGASAQETMLAADVSLVASGVGKGCTPENLSAFLVGKGINPVEVVMLTKPEVINEVRTLTFRVAVKPEEYEAALKPEVWPYRVAVRHFKAPRRERSDGSWKSQSEQSGGRINRDQAGRQSTGGSGRQSPAAPKFFPPGHASQGGQHQQLMEKLQPSPIELSNLFDALSKLNGEIGLQAQH